LDGDNGFAASAGMMPLRTTTRRPASNMATVAKIPPIKPLSISQPNSLKTAVE
jgi:hypothetical protein